jgi:MFS transporter, putative metabolite:H+ symporter
VVNLFESHGVGGVMVLMIGMLALQIAVVALYGIEPRRRGLEEIERTSSDAFAATPLGVAQITAEHR